MVISSPELVDKPVKAFKFGEEYGIREIGIHHTHHIEGVKGGFQLIARILDGFHVPGSYIPGSPDESEFFRGDGMFSMSRICLISIHVFTIGSP
jgi:hypothetical protein